MVKDKKKRADAASGVLQNLAEAQMAAKDAEEARKTQERKVAADTVTKTLSAVAGNAEGTAEKRACRRSDSMISHAFSSMSRNAGSRRWRGWQRHSYC